VVLDRSWETQSVTWSQLTWWDPLPCGAELVSLVTSPCPLPLPSPSHSLMGHPPSPNRSLPPTHLNFRSRSSTPSPVEGSAYRRYSLTGSDSSCSPLAWPLPHSPDSYTSVFLPSSYSSSPDCLHLPPTPDYPSPLINTPSISYLSSSLPQAHSHNLSMSKPSANTILSKASFSHNNPTCSAPFPYNTSTPSFYPTPPNTDTPVHRQRPFFIPQSKVRARKMFNFPFVPPPPPPSQSLAMLSHRPAIKQAQGGRIIYTQDYSHLFTECLCR